MQGYDVDQDADELAAVRRLVCRVRPEPPVEDAAELAGELVRLLRGQAQDVVAARGGRRPLRPEEVALREPGVEDPGMAGELRPCHLVLDLRAALLRGDVRGLPARHPVTCPPPALAPVAVVGQLLHEAVRRELPQV